jgi:hypothetical protein
MRLEDITTIKCREGIDIILNSIIDEPIMLGEKHAIVSFSEEEREAWLFIDGIRIDYSNPDFSSESRLDEAISVHRDYIEKFREARESYFEEQEEEIGYCLGVEHAFDNLPEKQKSIGLAMLRTVIKISDAFRFLTFRGTYKKIMEEGVDEISGKIALWGVSRNMISYGMEKINMESEKGKQLAGLCDEMISMYGDMISREKKEIERISRLCERVYGSRGKLSSGIASII